MSEAAANGALSHVAPHRRRASMWAFISIAQPTKEGSTSSATYCVAVSDKSSAACQCTFMPKCTFMPRRVSHGFPCTCFPMHKPHDISFRAHLFGQGWQRRLAEVEGVGSLHEALLEAETVALPLMDGAPRNSTDAQMAAWPQEAARLMPSAPRDGVRVAPPCRPMACPSACAVHVVPPDLLLYPGMLNV